MKINHRTILTCTLTAQTPISVGGLGADAYSDIALAVNGSGDLYIPGTSLAGPLRDASNTALWGYQVGDEGQASRVIVRDAKVPNASQEVREHVRISSRTGTALDGLKFNRANLPKGTQIEVEIQLDTDSDPTREVDRLVGLLQSGSLRLGGAKTRGLGRVKADKVYVKKGDLASAKGLVDWLRGVQPEVWRTSTPSSATRSFAIAWQPSGPLMVKAEVEGFAVDMLPEFSQTGANQYRLVVPGSSWKGALRACAEMIVNTVKGWNPDDDSPPPALSSAAECGPIVELFGRQSEKGGKGSKGALQIDDVYSVDSFNGDQVRALAYAGSTNELITQMGPQGPVRKFTYAPHVAIDRWTSGPSEGALFSVLEPTMAWEPLHIEVPSDLSDVARGLLLVVWREVVAGRVPIGAHVNRGMGQLGQVAPLEFSQEERDAAVQAWRNWCNGQQDA